MVTLFVVSAAPLVRAAKPPADAAADVERTPLRRTAPPAESPAAPADAGPPALPDPAAGFGAGRVVLSLGVVVALIFALKLFGKRALGPAGGGAGAAGMVQVIARCPIGPRQQVTLLKVGSRVLVLADGGTSAGLRTLAEIADAEEVAALVGQAQQRRPESASATFAGLIARAGEAFGGRGDRDEPTAPPPSDGDGRNLEPVRSGGELDGLLTKIRAVSRQLGA